MQSNGYNAECAQRAAGADAPGFDRAAFHKQFNADVLAFFQAQLGER
jgi:predicted dienelactone hydrolase